MGGRLERSCAFVEFGGIDVKKWRINAEIWGIYALG